MEIASGEGTRTPRMALDPERLLVSLVALGSVAALYALRALDDNRLTSWRWVFANVNPVRLFALAAAGIAVAHLAPRLPVPRRARAPALFVLAYVVAACFWGEPEIIVDVARYFSQAKYLATYGVARFLGAWGADVQAWTDLPLVPFLYGVVFEALGESRVHVQALTTLLFAGTVVVTHRLGAALWGDEVGLAAGALLLAAPYLFTQVPGMLVDVPTMFFVALAVLASTRALQDGGATRIALASAAIALALLSKYSAWLLLSVLPVSAVVLRRARPGTLRTAVAIGAVVTALVACAVLPMRHTYAAQLSLLVGYQAPGLRRWGESFASIFLFQVHPFLTAAALASIAVAIRRRDPTYAVVAWPVLLLALGRVHRVRYWVPALPMLALMGAYGLRAIARPEVRRHIVACAVASTLVVALTGYLPFLMRTSAVNLKAAAAYLDALEERTVEVFAVARPGAAVNPAVTVPILDLYTRKQVVHRAEEMPFSALERARASALRFTWEYRIPAYYAGSGAEDGAAVAVISDDLVAPLPERVAARLEGLRLARVFDADEGVFENRTVVRVYLADPGSSTGAPRPEGRPR